MKYIILKIGFIKLALALLLYYGAGAKASKLVLQNLNLHRD
jgi:hypothetical protein